jgi:hypothetical protein
MSKRRTLEVLSNDDGIRPAGSPDACFYCRKKVGELHKTSCVMIRQEVELEATFEGSDFKVVFRSEEPWSWNEHDIVFRYNDSTWCADNLQEKCEEDLKAKMKVPEGQCLCNVTTVRLVRVVDVGPFTAEGRRSS